MTMSVDDFFPNYLIENIKGNFGLP